MDPLVQSAIFFLATLTLLGQILSIALLISIVVFLLSSKKKGIFFKVVSFFGKNSLSFSLIVASLATAGSLFLSDIARLVPCKLCWYQRILMYPQVVVAGVGLIANEKVEKYLLPLSVIGIAISIYHYVMQLFPDLLECSEETAKCSATQFMEYGYITIPVMAMTAFMMIILFNVSSLLVSKER